MVNHEISHESVFIVREVSRAFKDLIVHWGACWVIDVWLLGCNVGNSHEQLSGDRLARISWPERANSRPSCRVAELGLSWSKPARLLMLLLRRSNFFFYPCTFESWITPTIFAKKKRDIAFFIYASILRVLGFVQKINLLWGSDYAGKFTNHTLPCLWFGICEAGSSF